MADRPRAFGDPLKGRYPRGAVDAALTALESVRPDYPEGGAIRRQVDDAMDRLYRFREIETGEPHPYRPAPDYGAIDGPSAIGDVS